jgi:hypothetical protein
MREGELKRCRKCRGVMNPCTKRFGVHVCTCCGYIEHARTISSVVEPRVEKRGQKDSPWNKVGGRI